MRNIANLMTMRNDDVKIDLSNRRSAMLRAADDPYAPNGTAEHAAYYNRLFAVVPKDGTITDEARRVLHYLRTLPLEGFNPLVAPLTGAKQEAAESWRRWLGASAHHERLCRQGRAVWVQPADGRRCGEACRAAPTMAAR